MIELLLPKHCAGCGAAGRALCSACRRHLARPPRRIFTPVDPHIPVWALGPYSGVHREVVLGMKERGRRDIPAYLGAVLGSGIEHLAARGELPEPESLTLVPAPTKSASARLRGGDPVTAVAKSSGLRVAGCVRHGSQVGESVGLSASARRRNLAGKVILDRIPPAPVLLVDDVVTTGSTLAETASVLFAANVQVAGALVICVA
ncbi:DNA utilization protein GntX [Corynebacterium kalinowskii]|uniref:DNA utilization protein GntX n=1 Tax=Corynebacterium kalinowskii TaxID=2675216 RepID=A0A6B8VMP0_9CORY|nr:ComF family protein [Corynebacterium kalinowskii]QGU02684.1 DNA utilization protein GntX [Corynebacterium kalinowskii]